MKNRVCRVFWVVLLVVGSIGSRSFGQNKASSVQPQAEVVVLSTLHQFHEEVPGYSYQDLKAAIERLHPDVLAVELTPVDLASRRPQKIKREYQNVVFPLLLARKWQAVPLEPEGERSAKLIAAVREAEGSLDRDFPQKSATADLYSDTQMEFLRERWHSATDVNSVWTDGQFAVKHAFLQKLNGPKEAEGWEGWNQYFLERITEAAKANPGKRIVVTVGAEHGYWLREHLRLQPGLKLLDTPKELGAMGCE